MKATRQLLSLVLIVGLSLSIMDAMAAESSSSARRIPVTTVKASTQNLQVWQVSQGRLLAKTAPMIAAEVGGRIIAVKVDVGQAVQAGQILAQIDDTDFRLAKELVSADIVRLQALIKAQQLQVKRFQELVRNKSANQSSLDNAEAQLGSLRAQLVGARVRLQQAERNISKTRITSPVNGRIDMRKVSVGDYLKAGTPLFKITALKTLQARLPFPEALASQLRVGLVARLTSPVQPGASIDSRISEIRPEISPDNLALDVLIDFDNKNGWEPGASVTGHIRTAQHKQAVVVPEGCIIRRPRGLVVYRIDNDRAQEVAVTTGIHKNGRVELLSGIRAGDILALDGAAYLTEGALVTTQQAYSGQAQ